MTTFQAIILGIIHGFTEILPVSSGAHQILVPYLLNWPTPSGAIAGAMALGVLLSILFYFRHDWASIISSFLQTLIFRKRPMTLDERLPFFMLLASVPPTALWYYFHDTIAQHSTPLVTAIALALFGIPLWLADSMSRKNKGMFDWNWLDSLLVGVGQALLIFPGCGRAAGALSVGLFRNFNREAIAKFSFYASMPILLATTIRNLHGVSLRAAEPMADVSWITFGITIAVSLLAGLLAIGGFMKNVQRKGFGQYVIYRCLLAVGVAVLFWIRL